MMVTIIAITIATIIKYLSVLSVQASALALAADAKCVDRNGDR
jgi:hypothetical protein